MVSEQPYPVVVGRPHRRMRRGLVVAIAGACLVLAGCGSGSDDSSSASSSSGSSSGGGSIPSNTKDKKIADMVPQKIRDQGYLSVASENYPTAVIVPEGGGAATGWEPAIAKQLGKLLGLDFRIKIVPFDSIIPGLQAKRFDIAMGQIAINDERRKVVIFVSEANSSDSFMVKKGSSLDIKERQDMCGHTVAVLAGSVEEAAVADTNAECSSAGKDSITIQKYGDQSAANLAVQSSRAEINVGSTSTLTYVVKQHPDLFTLQGSFTRADGNITGIAIARTSYGKQLGTALQAGMNKLIKNGTMKAIMQEWNGGEGLIPQSKLYP
jgi:polar amino acid transport system substrate-binding protein